MRRAWMTRTATAGAALLLLVGALSGCAPSGQQLNAEAAEQLQASVLAVTRAAAAGDFSEAVAALDALEERVTEGTASGAIDPGRSARIQASIDLVRADLAAEGSAVAGSSRRLAGCSPGRSGRSTPRAGRCLVPARAAHDGEACLLKTRTICSKPSPRRSTRRTSRSWTRRTSTRTR